MERKCVVVAFGDILGFGVWSRRAANTPEVRDPFIIAFYSEIERFLKANSYLHAKFLGDGFMIVKELPDRGHKCGTVLRFIIELQTLTRNLIHIVRTCPFPPPDGFRLRIASGHVTKFMVTDPDDPAKKKPEYVAYAVNLAQRLLEVAPKIPIVAHESAIKILGVKKKKIKLRLLANTTERPRGVDLEDIAGLWIIEL